MVINYTIFLDHSIFFTIALSACFNNLKARKKTLPVPLVPKV